MRSETTSKFIPRSARIAAAGALALATSAGTITAGLFPANAGWAPAWIGLTGLYVVGAVALWKGRGWAREFMLGVAGWGFCAWLDALVVVGPSTLTVAATFAHALMIGLAALVPARLERRHSWSLLLASAALPCGIAFGLAPDQPLLLAATMLVGAGMLVTGATGLARGRAWGLFMQLAGAPMMAAAAWYAPKVAWLQANHPVLPDNGVLLSFIGMCAAVLAAASWIPFVGPVSRHLRRG
jgi:hypothetical protein